MTKFILQKANVLSGIHLNRMKFNVCRIELEMKILCLHKIRVLIVSLSLVNKYVVAISFGESIKWQGLYTYFSVCMSQPFNICNWPKALCTLLCGSRIKRQYLPTCILHILG